MLLKFKKVDKFGNLEFQSSEKGFPESYQDLLLKRSKIEALSLGTYNPIYHSEKYRFCIVSCKKYEADLIAGAVYEVVFDLVKCCQNGKTYVNAKIREITMVSEPIAEEILDF